MTRKRSKHRMLCIAFLADKPKQRIRNGMKYLKIKQSVVVRQFNSSQAQAQADQFLLLYEGKSWKINGIAATAVKLLENDHSFDELMDLIHNDDCVREKITEDEVNGVVGFLKENLLIEGQNEHHEKKNGEWLRINLIPGEAMKRIKILPALFSRTVFWPFMILNLSWLIFMLVRYSPRRFAGIFLGMTASQIGDWLAGVAALSIFHELGHVSALVHCGGIPGHVGLTMNYMLPRFRSDTNDVWRFTKKDRLYVDAGGIYFQLLLSMILYIINVLHTKSEVLLMVCIASAIIALINLTPNPGSDGYWIVRDALDIEDLSETARAMFYRSSANVKQKEKLKVASVIVLRNMAVIYLLAVILCVLGSAVALLGKDIASMAGENGLSLPLLLRLISERPACLVAIAVSMQNILISAGKVRRKPGRQVS